jgi:hypothetical protein
MDIQISFTLNSIFETGDRMKIGLHQLRTLQSSSVDKIDLSTSLSYYNATWYVNESSLVIVGAIDLSAGQHVVSVKVGNIIDFSHLGISYGQKSAFQLTLVSANLTAYAEVSLPCIGICNATMIPLVAKAGYFTSYSVAIKFGGLIFNAGDKMIFDLVGFERYASGQGTVTSELNFTSVYAGITLSWTSASSKLTMMAASSGSYDIIGHQSLSFEIPASFFLATPVQGIRANQSFNASIETMTGRNFSSSALRIGPVGKITYSRFTLSSLHPGKSTNLTIVLETADDLEAGDQIIIFVPKFSITNGPILFYPLEKSANFLLFGEATSYTTRVNVDGSTVQIESVAKLIITLLTPYSSDDRIYITVADGNGIVSPVIGLSEINQPTVAIISKTSPVSTVNFQNYTTFGSLSPSRLVQPPYGSYGLINYVDIIFTANCELQDGDNITVIIPNLSIFGRNITAEVLNVNSTNITTTTLFFYITNSTNATNVTSTSLLLAPDIKASWSSAKNELTLMILSGELLL